MPRVTIKVTITMKNRQALPGADPADKHRAAVFLARECRIACSKPNTFFTVTKNRRRYWNLQNKLTGEPPLTRTGDGMNSIKAIQDRISMLKYMLFLDQGTGRISPRPWLLATIERHKKRIANLALGISR